MKNVGAKLGFTLIELLVVITIIGILATGAVTMYSSQIQKARDSGRVTDLKSLQGAIVQVYQDVSVYPSPVNILTKDHVESINGYITNIPRDSKTGNACAWWSYCGYTYVRWVDTNNIADSGYEISTAFESASNLAKQANVAKDFWDDDNRFELWNNKALVSTTAAAAAFTLASSWACTIWDVVAANDTDIVVFAGWNPWAMVAANGSCQ